MASKTWAKKVAEIKERQMVQGMSYAERIAYIQSKNGVQPTVRPQPVYAPQPQPETCPQGGAHDWKTIEHVGCYRKHECAKCHEISEVDSSD